ncbi:MAG: RHS repeat-associated core domain-containing protein [Saprospiraceae bacterium]|nr:RHS repeat-associated core domain-containing protein [Saprospiraceae bacterium]
MKKINYAGGSLDTLTYYIYDAQGNVLSTYQKVKQTSGGSYAHVRLQDIKLYGSERLGNMKVDSFMYATARLGSAGVVRNYSMGKKIYELTDHLGNVYSTITDRRLGSGTAGQVVTVWNPDVLTAQDYLPYGMPIYDKLYKANITSYYKYAFNGKEKDDETKGAFNSYDYGYRIYDPRVCRFLSVDPLKFYPSQVDKSPYASFWSNPIKYNDPDGRCPQCLPGFIIGFVSDAIIQIASNKIQGKPAFENFSFSSATISGGAGMLSGGVSSLAKLGKFSQIALNTTIDASESVTKQVVQSGSISATQLISDIALGGLGNQSKVVNNSNIKIKENALNRSQRIGKENKIRLAKSDLSFANLSNAASGSLIGDALQKSSDEFRDKLKPNGLGMYMMKPVEIASDNTRVVLPLLENK